jgi:hypothetical protein
VSSRAAHFAARSAQTSEASAPKFLDIPSALMRAFSAVMKTGPAAQSVTTDAVCI